MRLRLVRSLPTRGAFAALALIASASGGESQTGERVGKPAAYAPADRPDPDLIARGFDDIEAERALKGAELDAIRRDIEISGDRSLAIAAEIEALAKDRETITGRLVATAARVQALESSISASEAVLGRHGDREAEIRVRLEGRRAVLAEVLAAAQRIGRRPPPALVVRPEDALGAVRSAIVLGAVLPELRVEAEALTADLAALVDVRQAAEAERDRLRADAGEVAEEERRLALLLDEKKKLSADRGAAAAAEVDRAATLAAKAQTLEELIGGMEKDLAAVAKARAAAAEAARLSRPVPSDAGRLQPAMTFAAAKGLLPLPVRGVTLTGYGTDDGFGGRTAGLTIATRAGARVTAPCDGWVVYAGPFRSYGQLLILNAGDGYHVVLAGMESIDVELDQFVLTGEPIGVMGNRRLASATAPDVGLSQPVLYIEFRKDGASIDPQPWWVASQDRKVRG